MSEEEIINRIEHICRVKDYGDIYTRTEVEAIDGLLDLYTKEKEKNKKLENRLNQMYNKQQIYDLDAVNHSNISFN